MKFQEQLLLLLFPRKERAMESDGIFVIYADLQIRRGEQTEQGCQSSPPPPPPSPPKMQAPPLAELLPAHPSSLKTAKVEGFPALVAMRYALLLTFLPDIHF